MKLRFVLSLLLCVFFSSSLYAETIVLKSGKTIEAKILEKTPDSIKIDIEGVGVTYFLSDVDTIDGNKVEVVQKKAESVVETTQAPAVETKQVSTPAVSSPDVVSKQSSTVVRSTGSEYFRVGDKRIDPKMVALVGLIVVIVTLVTFFYGAICLWIIAKKTETTPAWLAFVPIGNLFLMCKIGKINYWWLALALLFWVPAGVGFVASLVFTGYSWYKIAIARGKKGWIGALVCIPVFGLLPMAYLAFSS